MLHLPSKIEYLFNLLTQKHKKNSDLLEYKTFLLLITYRTNI